MRHLPIANASRTWARRVPAALAFALAAAVSQGAAAQTVQPQSTLCIRKANPLPYQRGSDPVWFSGLTGRTDVRTDLNEPRWGASPLTLFFNDQGNPGTSEGGIRLILSDDSSQLSVSIQNKSGVAASTDMGVFFGIVNDATGAGYAFQTNLYTASQVTAGPYNTNARTQIVVQASKANSTASWVVQDSTVNPALNPVIVPNSLTQWTSAPGNSTVEGGADWAIQFRLRLLERLAITPTTPFRVYVGMRRRLADGREALVSAPYIKVEEGQPTPTKIAGMAIPVDPNLWQPMPTLATGCPNGISVKGGSIGTTNNPSDVINTDAGVPNVSNTFVAEVDPGNQAIGPNQLKARFRVANWGAQVENRWSDEWKDVPNGSAVLNTVVPLGQTRATGFTFNCGVNSTGKVCGTLDVPADPHQCMAVEVSNNGSNNFLISSGNAYNNMRFLPLSAKTEGAAISIRGLLNKHGRAGDRDVIIKVVTRNMPTVGNLPIFLDFQLLNWVKTILVDVVNFINPWGRSLSDVDMMKVAWPTYEVHVYYDTGRSNTYRGGATYREYSPLVSYGYYVSHEGIFFGYAHKMLGDSRTLNPIPGAANSYSVTVPSEGRVFVTNAIASEDVPAFLLPQGDRTCQIWPQLCDE